MATIIEMPIGAVVDRYHLGSPRVAQLVLFWCPFAPMVKFQFLPFALLLTKGVCHTEETKKLKVIRQQCVGGKVLRYNISCLWKNEKLFFFTS